MENLYEVTRIEGEYAYLKRLSDGEELFIAIALLPFGCDIGTKLEYSDFEFKIA